VKISLLEQVDTRALVSPKKGNSFFVVNSEWVGTKFAMLNVKNIAFNLMAHYDVQAPGRAEDYMPKLQSMGVFRPSKPVIFTLKRKRVGVE